MFFRFASQWQQRFICSPRHMIFNVTLAKAGVHRSAHLPGCDEWIPAFAGMTFDWT